MKAADIAIVGAGPAGARAAYVLARQGARVVMFDASHPREKPCGGGVTGRALALVADAVNVTGPETVGIRTARFTAAHRFDGARLEYSDGAVVPLDNEALVVSTRASFDEGLLNAATEAGAVHERARVLDVAVAAGHVTIMTRHGSRRADFVIGADGPNSLVRRRLAHNFGRDQLSIATGFFAEGVTSDEIVLEFVTQPPGYIWSFPRRRHLAIGMCAQADCGISASALRRRTAAWIERTGVARGATLHPYSWPIPSLNLRDFDALEFAGPRWCLAGDAGGLVDPITREGIFFALSSGQWAAESLLSTNPGERYSTRVRDEAVPELARAARLKAGFFEPRFRELVMRALHESDAIRRVMADLIAGRQSYARLKWRLLSTLELGLAYRWLGAALARI
jgi:geranylgeranyl reductase family protein